MWLENWQCKVDSDPFDMNAKVWFYREGRGRSIIVARITEVGENGRVTITEEEVDNPFDIAPSMALPWWLLETLVKASSEHVDPEDATREHLKDAITVRDRLLSIVERDV